MQTKKEFIKMMLKKYNKSQIKVVDKIDPNFAGSLSNGQIKIVFDVDKDFLIIQDNITIDNISLYYEFMSDEDLEKYFYFLITGNNELRKRFITFGEVLNTENIYILKYLVY